ncbi:MAG: endonuclease domain-containing protein [Caulobacteraceae bacterium]
MNRKRFLTAPGVAARLKSDRAVPLARRLRKNMTESETQLWSALRRMAPERAHFRKQAPIGPFIVDFASHAAKLVVEVDGGAHDAPDVSVRDVERQAWIEGRGYKVLRFRSEAVLKDPTGVARLVAAEAEARLG